MKKRLNFLALVLNFVLAFAAVFLITGTAENSTAMAAAAITAVSAAVQYFAPMRGSLMMGLQVEIWQSSIEQMLLEDNSWLNGVADVDDSNIINGKIVHIPQAGPPSAVVKNRSVFPAEVKRRTDGEVLYAIDEYTTDPVHIQNAETVELSYDKIKSVLQQDIDNLTEEIAEGMLTNLIVSPVGSNATLPTTSILQTEGAAVASGLAGTSGNRKAYSIADLQRAQNFMRKQKAWQNGNMNALLTPDAAVQMFPADSPITATYMAAVTEEERRLGIMYKCQGWNIYVRSGVYALSTDNTFKSTSAVPVSTDSEGILFWNKNMVEKAIGDILMFDDLGNPVYYGDIYSLLVRVGGRARRKNFEGVLVMKQAAAV